MDILLGVDADGADLVLDISGIRHLYVGGMHKSGKSNYLQYIITSLVTRYTPSEVQFVIFNAKKDEFNMFETMPHLAHPLIDELDECAILIQWLYSEMEKRYKQISVARESDIENYNKFTKGKMSRILFIVDECSGIFQREDRSTIEKLIIQLISLGNGVGIHLVFTSTYNSDKAVPPMVKAHFTADCSFAVRTDDDLSAFSLCKGAENLAKNGDMLLYLPMSNVIPIKLHIPLIHNHLLPIVV